MTKVQLFGGTADLRPHEFTVKFSNLFDIIKYIAYLSPLNYSYL